MLKTKIFLRKSACRRVVDASSFVSSDGESLAVWHISQRLYTNHRP